MITFTIIACYLVCVVILAIYTLGQAVLLIQYLKNRHERTPEPMCQEYPSVTIQLPIYNEQHVVQRLLCAVSEIDYPRDKLCVQILDDSTDCTSAIIVETLWKLRGSGVQFQHIRRQDRSGYKAGALRYGVTLSESEFFAIFDADFVPPPDFLVRTIPYLIADETLGFVQTRWDHLNSSENPLTRAQRLSIDAHFVVEQTARYHSHWLFSFNGSAGVWRRSAIEEAGGWLERTLTEDLDLSYRAQSLGWHGMYLPTVSVKGEIPSQLAAYKQQQARWAMGNTQCLRVSWKRILFAPLSFTQKVMALHHLMQYVPHVFMLAILILTPLMILIDAFDDLQLAPLGIIAFIPPLIYVLSQQNLNRDWKRNLLAMPMVILLGIGLIWNNSKAIWNALVGKEDEFKRTPKFAGNGHQNTYGLFRDPSRGGEIFLLVYAVFATILAWHYQSPVRWYLFIYIISFAVMILWSFRDNRVHEHGSENRQPSIRNL